MAAQVPVNPFANQDENPQPGGAAAEVNPPQASGTPQFPSTPIAGGSFSANPSIPGINVGAGSAGPVPGGPQVGQPPLPGQGQGGDQVIDLTNVKTGGQDPIDIGRWLGFVSEVDTTAQSKAGNPMVVFTFTVMAGPMTGRSRRLYCALTPDALFKLKETLIALGIDEQRPSLSFIAQTAPGRVALMNVIAGQPYNGNPTTDFNRVELPTEFGIAPGSTRDQVMQDPRFVASQ